VPATTRSNRSRACASSTPTNPPPTALALDVGQQLAARAPASRRAVREARWRWRTTQACRPRRRCPAIARARRAGTAPRRAQTQISRKLAAARAAIAARRFLEPAARAPMRFIEAVLKLDPRTPTRASCAPTCRA
jgi:hypothetical protein